MLAKRPVSAISRKNNNDNDDDDDSSVSISSDNGAALKKRRIESTSANAVRQVASSFASRSSIDNDKNDDDDDGIVSIDAEEYRVAMQPPPTIIKRPVIAFRVSSINFGTVFQFD